MSYIVSINKKYKFYEVENKPSEKELTDYYEKKYFQNNLNKKNQYKEKYSDQDLVFINQKIKNKYNLINQNLGNKKINSFIDIGCGEGFALSFFLDKKIDSLGVDFSDFGIKSQNPNTLKYFKQGDILTVIDKLIEDKKTFDLVWIDNVLEHVIDPESLIRKCSQLCSSNGFLAVEVPNDFSNYQSFVLDKKLVDKKYWQITPDHLSYFSPTSLTCLCELNGWKLKGQMTDFPIELFLLNTNSNYSRTPSTGKGAHQSRMLFEEYINTVNNEEQVTKLYQTLLESGLGRQIIGIYQKV